MNQFEINWIPRQEKNFFIIEKILPYNAMKSDMFRVYLLRSDILNLYFRVIREPDCYVHFSNIDTKAFWFK